MPQQRQQGHPWGAVFAGVDEEKPRDGGGAGGAELEAFGFETGGAQGAEDIGEAFGALAEAEAPAVAQEEESGAAHVLDRAGQFVAGGGAGAVGADTAAPEIGGVAGDDVAGLGVGTQGRDIAQVGLKEGDVGGGIGEGEGSAGNTGSFRGTFDCEAWAAMAFVVPAQGDDTTACAQVARRFLCMHAAKARQQKGVLAETAGAGDGDGGTVC